jgi:hypothetical protein
MKIRNLFLLAIIASTCYASRASFAQEALLRDTSTPSKKNEGVQQTDFRAILAGTEQPLKLKMKDLTPEFRRFTLRGSATYLTLIAAQYGGLQSVYYTQGNNVTIGSETYLVAYRPEVEFYLETLTERRDFRPTVKKPSPNIRLNLTLLNLRTSETLYGIRPFDPVKDMLSQQELLQNSVAQLERLGKTVIDVVGSQLFETFPVWDVDSLPLSRRVLVRDRSELPFWRSPVDNEFYAFNAALSNVKLHRILNASYLPLVYEGEAAPDNTRAVYFVDGHIERVTLERWERLKKVQPILSAD